MRQLQRAARLLGPRAADLGSGYARRVADAAFVAGLACDEPAIAPLVRGSLDALPFASGVFTGVLVRDAERPDIAARELFRVLQPGGHAVVAPTVTEWHDALVAAGFDVSSPAGGFVARRPGGAQLDVERPGLLSMFVPRAWLERRR